MRLRVAVKVWDRVVHMGRLPRRPTFVRALDRLSQWRRTRERKRLDHDIAWVFARLDRAEGVRR